jgi:hypothetical protein
MIHGLYSRRLATHAQIAKAMKVQRDSEADPVQQHDAAFLEPRLREEVSKLGKVMDENESLITRIEALITDMQQSGWSSAERTLAIRHLEDASSRLRRELGDHPVD